MGAKLINNGKVELTSNGVLIFGDIAGGSYEIPYINIESSSINRDMGVFSLTLRATQDAIFSALKIATRVLKLYYEKSEQRRIEELNQKLIEQINDCDVNVNNAAESVINRLYKLHSLKENGIVTEQEFLEKRNAIIESARH